MKNISQKLLMEVSTVIAQLEKSDYSIPLKILNGNSIGKHVRHILDLFECLIDASQFGIINYDERKRNPETETNKEFTLIKISKIIEGIESLNLEKEFILKQNLDDVCCEVNSSVKRELLYNIEHCIHHLAIIRIGIESEFAYISVPEKFGVAYSTLSHREQTIG